MMRGKRELYITVIMLVLIQGFFILSSKPSGITGAQTYQQDIYSEAQIMKYVSISSSGNLSEGIDFGTITSLPATNVNASKNYNSTIDAGWYNETLYWINVSIDSSVDVDMCIKADDLTTSGGQVIGIGNYSWDDNLTNNVTWPALSQATALSTSYQAGTTDITPGNNDYYRFWLSVPAGQQAGTYNNTVYFKGVEAGIGCGL